MRRRYSIDDMHEIAALNGGECLSDEYVSGKSYLRWKCAAGHVWETAAALVISGAWCARCAKLRHSIEEMRDIARSHGGDCLSKNYGGTLVKLRWVCERAHEWRATPNTILGGSWCPTCRRGMGDIATMTAMARERGGECLSKTYVNQWTKLRWRCAEGHEWQATPHHIRHARSWCPRCAGSVVTIDDMRALARKRGGECLSKRYAGSSAVMEFRCAAGHVFRTKAANVRAGHWCRACAGTRPLTLSDVRAVARERGGKLISTKYVNQDTKLRWRCARGHEWDARPSHVIHNRSWCPECAPSHMATIEEMRAIARERGGRCLSKHYIKSRVRLSWQCSRGHRFDATPMAIQAGRWCLICKRRGSMVAVPGGAPHAGRGAGP